jgi:hypothetical protein
MRVREGRQAISRGRAAHPRAGLHTDAATFAALITGRLSAEDAAAEGRVRFTGEDGSLRQLLDEVARPARQPA